MASADVHYKALVLLLLDYVLLLSVFVGFVFGPCFIMQYLVSFLVFTDKEKAGCFTLVVFLHHVAVSVLCLFLMVRV